MAVSVIYIILILVIPEEPRRLLLPFFLFTEPSVLGIFFIGGILFFEKEQGTLNTLFITPVRPVEYLVSQTVSLAMVALGLCAVILAVSGNVTIRTLWILPGILMTSVLFTCWGIVLASRSSSLMNYLIVSGLSDFPIVLPLLDHFGLMKSNLLYLIPTQGTLTLIRMGLGEEEPVIRIILAFLSLGAWLILFMVLGGRALKKIIFSERSGS
jgi:fluoroquinolone transport system permease protein